MHLYIHVDSFWKLIDRNNLLIGQSHSVATWLLDHLATIRVDLDHARLV